MSITDLGTRVAASKLLVCGADGVQDADDIDNSADHTAGDDSGERSGAASGGLASLTLGGRSWGAVGRWCSGGSDGHGEDSDDGLELHFDCWVLKTEVLKVFFGSWFEM